jgi:FKBP-type peptidyl-prolyl cis-trans isomerase SlyD
MMETNGNKYIEVDYELFVPNEKGNFDLVEKTSKEHPFGFVTGLGFALDAFEQQVESLAIGDLFDFTIPVDDAYGEFSEEHVVELQKDIFNIDGKFDETRIYPGNVIPLANADGNRFDGIVKEVRDDVVIVDLNHPLAGKPLHFKGQVVSSHSATSQEVNEFLDKMNGGENCDCCEKNGDCDCDDENGCCGEHEGHCCHQH